MVNTFPLTHLNLRFFTILRVIRSGLLIATMPTTMGRAHKNWVF